MTRRLIPALLGPLMCLVLLAGCGSSSKTTSTASSSTTSAPSSSSSSTSSTGTSSTPSTSVPANAPASVKAAVEECKSIIHAETTLSASAREKLEGACAEAAKGNTSVVKKVAREVCEETINSSALPQAAKQEADATCRKN